MHLERLSLTHFKSYASETFEFSPTLNCLVGENGSGKTNLLDAIYYLSLTKSALTSQDAFGIQHGADFFMLDGQFVRHEKPVQIMVSFQRGQRKVVLHDRKPYEKLSEHIGRFPVVLVAPDDTDLVREGSEERRKFIDGVLSQLDAGYLADLLQYNRLLDQRNGLLRQFSDRGYLDEDLLDVYSEPLVELAQQLFVRRRDFLVAFLPRVQHYYAYLGEGREVVDIQYESEVGEEAFGRDFRLNRQRDVAAQRTTKGSHKDDYAFTIDGFPLKKYGSQGQQKSFVIALKLAQFELLTQDKGFQPLLLLDDIFDKLDDRRIQKLIALMDDGTFGQVFLTDARPERTEQLLAHVRGDVRYLRIRPQQVPTALAPSETERFRKPS
jgi:DNA replication and repair protein RecF